MQDPETYLKTIGVAVKCIVDTEQDAILDAEHRTCIGFETYFFSSELAKRAFDSDILRYCGILTDPVTKARFRPTADSPRTEYGQRLFLFASDSCKATFELMPDMYSYPNYSMLPKPGEMPQAD